jgi:ATP-dependent exoDNAse (exonuclease V) alpha subunit
MAAAGRLDEQSSIELGGRRFAVGDQVVCLANARRLGVANGTRGTITEIAADQTQLRLRTIDGRDVDLPQSYLEAQTPRGGATLDHGYALTGHKAQGMTTGRAFVLGTEELYREWGYVAMSRGRLGNHLYVVAAGATDREEIAPADERRRLRRRECRPAIAPARRGMPDARRRPRDRDRGRPARHSGHRRRR